MCSINIVIIVLVAKHTKKEFSYWFGFKKLRLEYVRACKYKHVCRLQNQYWK
jgi:hypothetical protein